MVIKAASQRLMTWPEGDLLRTMMQGRAGSSTEEAVEMGADGCVEMRQEIAWDRCAMSPATTMTAGSMATGLLTGGAVEMTADGCVEMRRDMAWDRCAMSPEMTVAEGSMVTGSLMNGALETGAGGCVEMRRGGMGSLRDVSSTDGGRNR